MRIEINWRFLILFTVVSAVGLGAIHLAHYWQVGRQVGVFLREADAARDAKETNREMEFLERYITARPEAIEERDRYARLLATAAKGKKQREAAYLTLDDVLRRDPGRDDLRRFTVDYALSLRTTLMVEAARTHIEYLLDRKPDDAELRAKRAFCLLTDRKYQAAAEDYQKAYTAKSDLLTTYDARARILREHPVATPGPEDEPDAIIRLMVERNRSNFRAHLIEAGYRRQFGQPAEVEAAVGRAKSLAPDELDVIMFVAGLARDAAMESRRTGDKPGYTAKTNAARAELDRGLKLYPNARELYLARARLEPPAVAATILASALEKLPNDIGLLETQAEYLLEGTDATATSAALARLKQVGYPADRLELMQARLDAIKGEWSESIRKLEKLLADRVREPDFARQVNLQLGRCYEQIGLTDQRRVTAFTKAIPEDVTDPKWIDALLGLARSYEALGRTDDALKTYERLADRAPGAWVAIARLRMLRAARDGDSNKADWVSVEKAVERANNLTLENDAEARLLKIKLAVFRKQGDEARKLLDKLLVDRPKEPTVWIEKASQLARGGSTDAAVTLLEKGRTDLGDPVEVRLALAGYLLELKDPVAAEKKLTALAEGADRYSPNEQRQLLRILAQVATAVGADALAGRLWDQLGKAYPFDLSVQLVRFDRARQANDPSSVERILNEIRRIDGDKGASARAARAAYLIWQAEREKGQANEHLGNALKEYDMLEREYPGWSRAVLGKAIVLDRLEQLNQQPQPAQPSQALPYFQKAVALGETSPDVIRRLAGLLYQAGRFAEANDLLTKQPSGTNLGSDAQRLAAELSLKTNDTKKALEYAKKAVPPESTNTADLIWLSQLQMAANERADAERTLRRVVEIKPDDPIGWLALIQHLMSTGRTPDAVIAFEQAKGRLRKEALSLFTARASAALGRAEAAKAAFELARRDRPSDLTVLQSEAEFLTNVGLLADARVAWERVINLPGATAEVKQAATSMLAVTLAADPDYATARRALDKLATIAGTGGPETPAIRRARTLVFALQIDLESKRKAIQSLEADQATLVESDRYLLAQLYDQVGDVTGVRRTMTELLKANGKSPVFLAFYSNWLLSQKDPVAAERWVQQLEAVQPDALRTAELKTMLFVQKKELDRAREVLRAVEKREVPPDAFLSAVAEKAGLYPEAERYLRRFADTARGKSPEVDLAVAVFVARRGRLREALDLCEAAAPKCPPAAVATACVASLIAAEKWDPADVKRVVDRLEAVRQKDPKLEPLVLQHLARVRNLEKRYDDVMAIYRGLSSGSRPDPLALNNLAYLLSAHTGQHDAALALIEQAKRLVGPQPELLDTEAIIRTARGKPDDLATARKLLLEVIALSPSGSAYFHLAVLEEKAGKRAEGQLAWRDARRRNLSVSDLHPLEWPAFRKMEAEWK